MTPVLSIRQPWAWLVVHAYKPVENRTWPTTFRGPLAIHAGKTMARRYYNEVVGNLRGMVVLSGYATALYATELQGWQVHTTAARISSGRGTGIRTEVVWLNQACVAALEHAAGGLFAEVA